MRCGGQTDRPGSDDDDGKVSAGGDGDGHDDSLSR
jgi:hypothetical protein